MCPGGVWGEQAAQGAGHVGLSLALRKGSCWRHVPGRRSVEQRGYPRGTGHEPDVLREVLEGEGPGHRCERPGSRDGLGGRGVGGW